MIQQDIPKMSDIYSLTEAKADIQKLINFAGQELADKFVRLKSKMKSPENDIYYWLKKTPNDLEKFLFRIENTKSTTQVKKEVGAQGATLIVENDFWKVYHITTFEASQKYGADTKWCITGADGNGRKFWDWYNSRYYGIKFYFFISKINYDPRGIDSKFALAVFPSGSGFNYEVYDQQDNKVNFTAITGGTDIARKLIDRVSPPPKNLETVIYDGNPLPENTKIKVIQVADGITDIPGYALFSKGYGNDDVVEINIPASVSSISFMLNFAGNSLVNINVDPANKFFSSVDGILYNKDETTLLLVPKGKNFTAFTVPDGVVTIGMGAFSGHKELKAVTFPDSLQVIKSSAFWVCDNLSTIDFGKHLRVIERQAFATCNKLQSIDLPEGITSIGYGAFSASKCPVYLPNSLTSIDNAAFIRGGKKQVIRVKDNSYAETWAKDNKFKIELVESYKNSLSLAEEFKLYDTLWD
jgi:hypothetical protein